MTTGKCDSDNSFPKIARFKSLGQSIYYYSSTGLTQTTNTIEDIAREFMMSDELTDVALTAVKIKYIFPVYDLLPGDNFAKLVHEGIITDYDGSIANVFVDGYDSNLGIIDVDSKFCQGNFLVDPETFLRICNLHRVEVNWANK